MANFDYGTDVSSRFSSQFQGVNLHVHGGPLTDFETKQISRTIQRLSKDYPTIWGKNLKSIHLYTHQMAPEELDDEADNPEKLSDLWRDETLKDPGESLYHYLNETKAGGLALPKGMFGMSEGTIGLHVGAIRARSIKGFKPIKDTIAGKNGQLAKTALSRSLTHEFGHHVHFALMDKIPNYEEIARESTLKQLEKLDFSPQEQQEMLKVTRNVLSPFMNQINDKRTAFTETTMGPMVRKYFPNWAHDRDIVGSDYALTNDQELFAEIFTRARIGHGTGAAGAKRFERVTRRLARGNSLGADSAKRLAKVDSTRMNAIKQLKKMGGVI